MMFDYDKALERFMGEKDILIEVLPSYLENLDSCLKEIKSLEPRTQHGRIRELAHSIKGSSLNLDIVALGHVAEVLEDLAYDENYMEIPECINKIVDLAVLTKSELHKYLN